MFLVYIYMSVESANKYIETFDILYNKYYNILNQISHNFIYYKIYPNEKQYLNDYNNNINALVKLENTILIKKKALENKNNVIQKKLKIINKKVVNNSKNSKTVLKLLNTLENQDNAIDGELIDKKYIYHVIYTRNIILLLIFLGCGISAIYKYKRNV
jgi:hypothetical protein